jgi:hypothetical protein
MNRPAAPNDGAYTQHKKCEISAVTSLRRIHRSQVPENVQYVTIAHHPSRIHPPRPRPPAHPLA